MNCLIHWCKNFPNLNRKQRLGVIIVILLLAIGSATAQELDPVQWEANLLNTDSIAPIEINATIEDGWYLYSQFVGEDGPIPTSFSFGLAQQESDETVYSFVEANEFSDYTVNTFDEMFQMDLIKYKKEATFSIAADGIVGKTVYILVEYMCCDDNQCLPPVSKELILNYK